MAEVARFFARMRSRRNLMVSGRDRLRKPSEEVYRIDAQPNIRLEYPRSLPGMAAMASPGDREHIHWTRDMVRQGKGLLHWELVALGKAAYKMPAGLIKNRESA